MKMPKRYKVYTNIKKINDDYYEVTYKEYIGTKLVNCGTEDFSRERLHKGTLLFTVYQYSGRINKAGGKMTEAVGTIRTSKNACKIQVAKMLYGNNVARVY